MDRTTRAHGSPAGQDWQSKVPCRFFARGQCRSGPSCAYSHAASTGGETPGILVARTLQSAGQLTNQPGGSKSQTDSRAQVICRFFTQGRCTKGIACPFSHGDTPSTQAPTNAPAQAGTLGNDNDDSEPMSDNCVREIGGALVTFGHGAQVTKVSLPSDFSAVRINNLPDDTTPASVSNLLSELGFDVARECIRVPPQGDKPSRSADVRVEDANFARHVCSAAKTQNTSYQVVSMAAPMPQATNTRRVDAKKVHCSWHKPTRTAWLNFRNGEAARAAATRFSTELLLGQKIKVNVEGPTVSYALGNNSLPWTVRLSDLPARAERNHVLKRLPSHMRRAHMEMSAPSYDADAATANALIESLLEQVGPLERWEGCSDDAGGKRFKAKARFVNEADARQAVEKFNDAPVPFNDKAKLTVQLVHSARLKVSTAMYDAIEAEIAPHKHAWAAQHLLYTAYPPDGGFRVLRIEGEVSADVAKAKTTLEKLLAGEVMTTVDGTPIWANCFAGNGRTQQKIRALEARLGIAIVRDKRKRQLRVLGPQSLHDEARRALSDLAAEDAASSVFVIELDDATKLAWAFTGGFRAIGAAIGPEKATLDIVSTPRRILVSGSQADFSKARDLVLLRGETIDSGETMEAASSEDCSICWTEAEKPVYTSCKHCYCSGCFEDLCNAGASSAAAAGPTSGPCITCQGSGGKCSERLRLSDLQDHLSSAALEDVLEASFAHHLASHPDSLRHCPSPDCTQIYRPTTTTTTTSSPHTPTQETLFTCPACLVPVCTTCHVSHPGLSCADHRERASSGYRALQQTKKRLGIKDCPKCGAMIEKTEGCNHMTCRICHTHMCWVCMEVFSEGGLVYAHMQKEHRGIGIEYWPGLM